MTQTFPTLAIACAVKFLHEATEDDRLPPRHRRDARAVLDRFWDAHSGDTLQKRAAFTAGDIVLGGLRCLAQIVLDPDAPADRVKNAREEFRTEATLLGLDFDVNDKRLLRKLASGEI